MGRLPAAGRAHDARDPPGADLEAHVAQHRRGVGVAAGSGRTRSRSGPRLPEFRGRARPAGPGSPAPGRGPRRGARRRSRCAPPSSPSHAIWRTGICRMAMKARKDCELPDRQLPGHRLLAAHPQHQAHGDEESEGHRRGALHEHDRCGGARWRARAGKSRRSGPSRRPGTRRRAPRGYRRGSPP